MSGYIVHIIFSHMVERIMTQTLEVNCLFNSLSRYFKDLWALSASQFVTVWKQHDFLEKWPYGWVTLQEPLLVFSVFKWSGPCNLSSIVSHSWVWPWGSSRGVKVALYLRISSGRATHNSEESTLLREWAIFLSGPIWSCATKSYIHYQVVLIICSNVQRAVPGTVQRELSCPVGP